MAPLRSAPKTGGYSRRAVLAGAGSAALFAGGVGTVGAVESEVPRTVVVPAVSEFEDDYEGQFLTIYGPATETNVSPADVHEACEDVPWPRDATEVNAGQLTDRRADTPVAVRLPVHVDARRTNLVEDALFVVNDATPCAGDFVRLDLVWVTTRSIVGKPPGPTVGEGDDGPEDAAGTDGPGFGPIAAVLGLSGALALGALRRLAGGS